MEPTPIEKALGKYQNLVVGGLAFIVVFAVTVMGIMLWQAYRLGQTAQKVEHVAITTHSALCALRADLQIRHDNGVAYLKANPNGFPGLPSATIQQSVDAQQDTLDALMAGGLTCP